MPQWSPRRRTPAAERREMAASAAPAAPISGIAMIRIASVTLLLLGLTPATWAGQALPATKTVCTVTVNSADEKEAFRRALPKGNYEFVELVERGRPDWLESSCRKGVRCDVLIISGHYDGGNEFFSDQLGAREYLPVAELERVSCSNSCPGLFSRLKEVYLFGCHTLDPVANRTTSGEIGRSLRRSGHGPAEGERLARALTVRHGESSRDRMRLVFPNVPGSTAFLGGAADQSRARCSRRISRRPARAGGNARPTAGCWAFRRTRWSSQSIAKRFAGRAPARRLPVRRRSPAGDKLDFVHELLRRRRRGACSIDQAQTASLDGAALDDHGRAALRGTRATMRREPSSPSRAMPTSRGARA
jgi:hypothetical protein